ncbi:MAG: S-methyl-5-thioribose-1-phosphate isomerase [Calditrichaeota bacterium]|nr:S-methyl-5-thioribose-1-phosphate isomerase [Calditrichota bacterium]
MTSSEEKTKLPPRRSIVWNDGLIKFIDQRLLPGEYKVVETDDWAVIAEAIRGLGLRGAPLIGVAAALAVAATAVKSLGSLDKILAAIEGLRATRPTAQNLFWALDRMSSVVEDTKAKLDQSLLTQALTKEALEILEDDRNRCVRIGENAQSLIKDNARILTICNTGFLATAGDGTALSAVYRAHDEGKSIHVYACETRPLLQGARLTAWELKRAEIPFTLIVDSAAAGLAAKGEFDICIIGADRIAANGDTVNKVGSYQLALACKAHDVPFYVAAPTSTIDTECPDGEHIPIEERSAEEIFNIRGKMIAPEGVNVRNPAFDLVPIDLITGIITENGVEKPSFS